jgi:DNA-binding SARP family transcriptional activator
MPPTLTIRLLGRFEVERDGQAIPTAEWRGQKPRDLLKILLLAKGHYVAKEQLCEWLWPNTDPSSAQTNLRSVVSDLRKALEPGLSSGRDSAYITTEREGYAFNLQAPLTLDVSKFEGVATNMQARRAEIENALTLYRGDLLEEDAYAEWVLRERDRLRELRLTLLNRLAEMYLSEASYTQSITTCEHALGIDPAQEGAWRTLMRAQAANGDRAAALSTFERCRAALARELGVDPSPETTALHERLLQEQAAVTSSPVVLGIGAETGTTPRWLFRIGAAGMAVWAVIGSINLWLAMTGVIHGAYISPGDPGRVALSQIADNPNILSELNSQLYLLFPISWLLIPGYIAWGAALRGRGQTSLVWIGLAAGIADSLIQTLAQAISLTQITVIPSIYLNASFNEQLSIITLWDVLRQLVSICGILSLITNPIAWGALALAMRSQARALAWLGVGIVAATVLYNFIPAGGIAFFIGILLIFGSRAWLLAVAVWLWLRGSDVMRRDRHSPQKTRVAFLQ